MSLDKEAIAVVEQLKKNGYIAYYAGGWVRDYLLGHPSDDIDIATSASPEEVMALFPKTVAVGASFGVVVVIMDEHHFEVASFRSDGAYVGGRKPESVTFSSPEEDAQRRDFTINGMFYDPIEKEIYDYVGGREDLEKGLLRTVGNPHERFSEDRLRMIRAVRFAVRFGFDVDPKTEAAAQKHASELFPAVSLERVWQELQRMAVDGKFMKAMLLMYRWGLLEVVFPVLKEAKLEDIYERLKITETFPADCPAIVYVMQLFSGMSLEEEIETVRYLKASKNDMKLVEFLSNSAVLFEGETEDSQWAQFHSHKSAEIALHVFDPDRKEGNALRLVKHIERMKNKTPLITSQMLKACGIKPGTLMGKLLRESERISVNKNLHDAELVMDLLKDSKVWKEASDV
jgi:poly(A) polymerase